MKSKVEKMNSIIRREISDIIQNEVKNSNAKMCTVTEVSLTNDLSLAKVYVTFMGNRKRGLEALNHAKGFIRSQLAGRIDIRKCPQIEFIYDTALENGNRIDSILKELNEEKKESD